MDKVKVSLDNTSFTFDTSEVNGIVVKNRIPYEMKEQFAYELVDRTLGTDDSLGVSYVLATYDLVLNYQFAKYYTNIDTEQIDSIESFRVLFDYMQINGLCVDNTWVREFAGADLAIVRGIEEKYRNAITTLYEAEHSLQYEIKKLLDTDPDTNNAETRELIEKLIDMKGALLEKEEQGKVIQFGKQKSANVKTGGAKQNQAKR